MSKEKIDSNRKRNRGFGYFIAISVMTLIFINLSTTTAISGCEGDCMTCHVDLTDSSDHQSLKTCVHCHAETNKKPLDLFTGASVEGGCGARCFTCHAEWPQDSAHVSLDTCLNCHEK